MDLRWTIIVFFSFCSNSGSTVIAAPGATCDNISNQERIDCHPDALGGDQTSVENSCMTRGCCWREATGDTFPGTDISTPWCFFPSDYSNYEVREFFESEEKMTITLKKTATVSGFPKDSKNLVLTVTAVSNDVVRIKILDGAKTRFEVPAPVLNDHPIPAENKKYLWSFDQSTGQLQIQRKSSNIPLFSINVKRIIYSNQFLEVTNEKVPSTSLYGLGESMDSFRKDFSSRFKKVVMLNSDQPPTRNLPLYGTHPFYLMRENEVESHGILFFNNNIQEVVMVPEPSITYRTTGGVLDFFVFLGPTNNDVMHQKMSLIGHTPMPPMWALGYQLCRYGYKNTEHVERVYNRTIAAGIPLDVKWVDIDYMKDHNDFTVDSEGDFKGLKEFSERVQREGRKFVPILDPAVSASEDKGTYPPYEEGVDMDIFIRNEDGTPFIGKVWNPETSIFPDFTHPRATEYWTRQMKRLHDMLPYDGMWIDMNEPANMVNGNKEKGCDEKNPLNKPPFMPGQDSGLTTYKKTMCPSAKQYLGSHYDLHNMYGYFEAKATYEALKTIHPKKRPYIVSRATVTGQNIYSHHWTGDVYSSFDHLKNSIDDILSINLFGISMVGADICGFGWNTNVELCARWQAVGAFYPFSRNHNDNNAIEQDPVVLGKVVVDATKNSLEIRYKLLPYLYTTFYENSITGHPVIRAPFWDHSWDSESETQASHQFLWGSALMIVPILEEGKSEVRGYFPTRSNWYNYADLKQLKSENEESREYWFHVPWEEITVTLRGNSVVPYHTETKLSIAEQKESASFGLFVVLSSNGEAKGQLFWDDGETSDTLLTGDYSLIEFHCKARTFKSNTKRYGFHMKPLTEIKVLGVSKVVNLVLLNGVSIQTYNYDEKSQVLFIRDLQQNFRDSFTLSWS